ncbi:Hydrogenase maturation factor HoxR [hydrothermal vent metagenome]|uniref:Hydrogenase maturation factor HoxR n=1 Tax=hydrothermal vent metagenome TaxID=652676 RepID=A0A1W1BZB5_9ZZZZ
MNTFEGSYLGNNEKIADNAYMECKICHYVYKPENGDSYWQIEANTPFSKLPNHWRCPNCDTPKEQFMVIERTDAL